NRLEMDWARILAFVTGMTDQELLARNEYLVAENRILKAKLKGRLKLSDAEPATHLLRARREWPRSRAAEQRDELAAFQLIELHSVPASQGRIAGYRIGEEQSGGISRRGMPSPHLLIIQRSWSNLFMKRAFRFSVRVSYEPHGRSAKRCGSSG